MPQDSIKSSKTSQTLLNLKGNKSDKTDKDSECRAQRELRSSVTQVNTQTEKKQQTAANLNKSLNKSSSSDGYSELQSELEDIKKTLKKTATKEDIDDAVRNILTKEDLQEIVDRTIKTAIHEIEKKFEEKLKQEVNKFDETISALSLENESKDKIIKKNKDEIQKLKSRIGEIEQDAVSALRLGNYNEQYSRKNNIKVFNFPEKQEENIKDEFIKEIRDKCKCDIKHEDILAIHRLPGKQIGKRPVIVKMATSEKKSVIMRARKNMRGQVRLVDDITKMNADLMAELRDSGEFESVWYFNCKVWALTYTGKRVKFDVYDDIKFRLKELSE